MKKLNFKRGLALFFGIFMSIGFVLGIPGIVLFAGKSGILLALSIILVVAGFYGMPMVWIHFGNLGSLKRLVVAVENEYIYDVKNLSLYLNISEKETINRIQTCIKKQYITGYLFDGNTLTINENIKATKKIRSTKCPNCGASVTISATSNKCEYCGKYINDDKKN